MCARIQRHTVKRFRSLKWYLGGTSRPLLTSTEADPVSEVVRWERALDLDYQEAKVLLLQAQQAAEAAEVPPAPPPADDPDTSRPRPPVAGGWWPTHYTSSSR
jgi:hypothetical protein